MVANCVATKPLWIVVIVLVIGISCRDSTPPSYMRLSGRAPAIAAAPTARALLIVFWATWCLPCREEAPQLRALAAKPPDGLEVIVVSLDTESGAIEEFFGGPPDPSLHLRLDPDKRLYDAFRVEALPAAFLVVAGELRARFEGSRQWDEKPVRALLERLVTEERIH